MGVKYGVDSKEKKLQELKRLSAKQRNDESTDRGERGPTVNSRSSLNGDE